MKLIRAHLRGLVAAPIAILAAAAAIALLAAQGPVPSLVPPFNIDMGEGGANPGAPGAGTAQCTAGASGNCTALILVGQSAGTVNSAALVNLDKVGVQCTISGITSTGGPTTTMAVQGFDAIANAWQTLGVTASLTAATPATLQVYPGSVNASAPTGLTLSGVAVPRVWRVQQVVTGGTGLSSKISCNVMRGG